MSVKTAWVGPVVLVLSQTIYNSTSKNIRPSLSGCICFKYYRTLGKKQEKCKALIKIFCLFYFKLGNNGYLVESFREQGLPAWLAHPQQVSSKIGELKLKRVYLLSLSMIITLTTWCLNFYVLKICLNLFEISNRVLKFENLI